MWATFFVASLAACLMLFVPGYCVFRALGFTHIVSLCAAPLGSVFAICCISTALGVTGLPTHAGIVSGITLMCCVAFLVVSRVQDARSLERVGFVSALPLQLRGRTCSFETAALACYVAFGLVVCAMVFIPCLTGSPDAFFSRWDNQTHMNMVRAFVDSESWSALRTGYYLGVDPASNPYANPSTDGFYPAAWHILCAYICSAVGTSVPLAANALNAVISSIVYPAGMFLLMKALFPKNRLAIASGVVITMAFTAFPWALYVKGPLYPNLFANALVPAFLGVVVLFFEQRLFPRMWFRLAIASLLGLFALVITQSNTVFSAYVFLAAYGGHYIYARLKESNASRPKTLVLMGIYIGCIVAFWTLCYNLPFLQYIVQYNWAATVSVPFAIAMAGSFAMPSFMPEVLLALVAMVGLVSCLRHRRFWIIFPALVMMVGFILDRSTSGFLKHFISGFWFTDPFRTAAAYAMFVTPVACLGFAAIIVWLRKRDFSALSFLKNTPSLFAATMLVFCVITYLPSITLPIGEGITVNTAFGSLHSRFLDSYRTDKEQVLSYEEREFIRRALEEIPEGSRVINQPCDGSAFAYGTEDLNTYYRSCRIGKQTDSGEIIRLSLDKYADDGKVREAVKTTGAEYLLQLDQGVAFEDGKWLPQYSKPQDWKGIDAVRDDTPGFTPILSEGDMRLYRIG